MQRCALREGFGDELLDVLHAAGRGQRPHLDTRVGGISDPQRRGTGGQPGEKPVEALPRYAEGPASEIVGANDEDEPSQIAAE